MACTGGEQLLSESEERFRGKRRPRKDGPIILTLDLSHSLIQSLIPPYGHSINVPAAAVRLKGRAAQQRRRRPIRGKIPAMIGNATAVFAAAAAAAAVAQKPRALPPAPSVRPIIAVAVRVRPSVGRSIHLRCFETAALSIHLRLSTPKNERTNERTLCKSDLRFNIDRPDLLKRLRAGRADWTGGWPPLLVLFPLSLDTAGLELEAAHRAHPSLYLADQSSEFISILLSVGRKREEENMTLLAHWPKRGKATLGDET